jgi:hypothetical protein
MDMTKAGATKLYIMPFQTFTAPEEDIKAFRDVIIPTLHSQGFHVHDPQV